MTTRTADRIQQYIEAEFVDPAAPQRIDAEFPLLDSGLINSLGVMRLVAFLEGEFAILVPDSAIRERHFGTIRSLSAFVDARAELRDGDR